MAESVVFSLACKILSTVASPAFQKAYEKGLFIWEAREELAKLRVTIETIQAVLLDAEKKQQGSSAVKNWIKRLKGVLYDADDLFDEVATDDMIKQQIMKGNANLFSKKVRVSCSRLNPIVSRNSIAKKVKTIRKNLLEISADMAQFEFVRCQIEEPMFGIRRGQDPGCFVDAKAVIGRDKDKKIILEMLFNESYNAKPDVPIVISIVGIGGMGKTTLAQLLYNDDGVKNNFGNRWFACIPDISDEKEVLTKIFQCICEESCTSFSMSQLQTKIRESIEGKKYLLVLDDVWEDHRGRWQDRMSLLSGGAKGSRIIVTTRLPSVVNAVGAVRAHNLEGLSEDDSWNLFKRLAFDDEYEKDPRRESLGREILKRCRCVPLAIRSIGSLLYEKNTILEWEAIEREDHPLLGKKYNDETLSVLKLSYDHLPANLKQCFAYCSLFPKDHRFKKHELIFLWIAQGYIEPNNEESDFMHLLRRGFFEEAKDYISDSERYKMHDIMHDLALYVAGEESIVLNGTSSMNTNTHTRHVRVVSSVAAQVMHVKWLRSYLLSGTSSYTFSSSTNLDKLFRKFKLLRTLSLKGLEIENLSPSIGELKLMRYLDLSFNNFKELPDSMTNLVNLLALDLMGCSKLDVLPKNFRKLINLRYLNIKDCTRLKEMPIGIGELTHLQILSHFRIWKRSELSVLVGLQQQLTGELSVWFYSDSVYEEDWDGDECRWKLPISVQELTIMSYPGIRISEWDNNGRTNNLARLRLYACKKVKYLPPLRCLPNLRLLDLHKLSELEFMENEDKHSCCIEGGGDGSRFFPLLEELRLYHLPKLKGWKRKVATSSSTTSASTPPPPPPPPQFPLLSCLFIKHCPELELNSFPLCPHLKILSLEKVKIQQNLSSPEHISMWLSRFQDEAFASLRCLVIHRCYSLKSLHLASPQLLKLEIYHCDELMSFELVEAATSSLKVLSIRGCKKLKTLHIAAHLSAFLMELEISHCPELELWELQDEKWLQLDWDSLSNLNMLSLRPLPPPEKLPHCLRHRQALGLLQIRESTDMPLDSDEEHKCLETEHSSEQEA